MAGTSGNDESPTSAEIDTTVDDGGDDDGPLPDFGDCDLETYADEIADASTKPVIDCGYVDKADELAEWQEVQLCILDAMDAGSPFKALYEPMTIDSVSYAALVGVVDTMYSFHSLVWRLDERGVASVVDNTHPDLAPGCEVVVGDLCLYSSGTSDMQLLCP